MKQTFVIIILLTLAFSTQAQWKDGGTKVTTTQNVGIGTDNPKYKLDIAGDTRTQNLLLPNGYRITRDLSDNFIYQDKTIGHYSIGWNSDSWQTGSGTLWQSGYAGIKFFTGGQFQMGIRHSGNVGIGTDNPQYKLDVAGDIRSHNLVLPNGYRIIQNLKYNFSYQEKSVEQYSIGWNSDSWHKDGETLWQSAYGGIKFFTGSQLRMGISYSGNVGIGTDNPQYKLDVVGNIRTENLLLPNGYRITRDLSDNFTYQDKTIGHYSIGWNSDSWYSRGGTLWQSGYGGIKFFTGGQFQIGIDIAGNVGIGTDKPQYKLDVTGTIRSTEIKVESLPWSDFVFEKDYKLRPLEDVKAHIEEHKHLPDIPSEKEVQEQGINIGEMQAKLLQKIEELTLYVIQQDEKNKALELEIKNLKSVLSNQ